MFPRAATAELSRVAWSCSRAHPTAELRLSPRQCELVSVPEPDAVNGTYTRKRQCMSRLRRMQRQGKSALVILNVEFFSISAHISRTKSQRNRPKPRELRQCTLVLRI